VNDDVRRLLEAYVQINDDERFRDRVVGVVGRAGGFNKDYSLYIDAGGADLATVSALSELAERNRLTSQLDNEGNVTLKLVPQ
jgi:hypothetical protein